MTEEEKLLPLGLQTLALMWMLDHSLQYVYIYFFVHRHLNDTFVSIGFFLFFFLTFNDDYDRFLFCFKL